LHQQTFPFYKPFRRLAQRLESFGTWTNSNHDRWVSAQKLSRTESGLGFHGVIHLEAGCM
jgi:hypothetical protein